MISFFVPGEPKTAGSKKAFVVTPKGGGKPRAVVTDDVGEPGKVWRADVRATAKEVLAGAAPLDEPLLLVAVFYLPRQKGHYGTGRNAGVLRDSAPRYHATRPDATKLLRAVEDALTGLVYRDDGLVVTQIAQKRYAEAGRVGASIRVAPLREVAETALVDLRPV